MLTNWWKKCGRFSLSYNAAMFWCDGDLSKLELAKGNAIFASPSPKIRPCLSGRAHYKQRCVGHPIKPSVCDRCFGHLWTNLLAYSNFLFLLLRETKMGQHNNTTTVVLAVHDTFQSKTANEKMVLWKVSARGGVVSVIICEGHTKN